MIQRWLIVGGNHELHGPGASWGRRTRNGEVRLLILDDRIFDDLFELCAEIACERDRVRDAECALADIGLAGLT